MRKGGLEDGGPQKRCEASDEREIVISRPQSIRVDNITNTERERERDDKSAAGVSVVQSLLYDRRSIG